MRLVLSILLLSISCYADIELDDILKTNSQLSPEQSEIIMQKVKPLMENNEVILIGGFMNELSRLYFSNVEEYFLNEMKIPSTGIHKIYPSSAKPVETNALKLVSEFEKIMKPNKKYILVCHSKGCIETVIALMADSRLLESVDKVISIQGAMKGAILTDIMMREAVVTGQITRAQQIAFSTSTYFTRFYLLIPGFRSLHRRAIAELTQKYLNKLDPSSVKLLNEKIFYVRSKITGNMSPEYRVAHYFLKRMFGDNDGTLMTEDQKMEVGTDLGIINADHGKLVSTKRKYGSKESKVFLDSVFQMAYLTHDYLKNFLIKTDCIDLFDN